MFSSKKKAEEKIMSFNKCNETIATAKDLCDLMLAYEMLNDIIRRDISKPTINVQMLVDALKEKMSLIKIPQ